MADKGYLPLAKRASFQIAGRAFAHPEEYRALTKLAKPAIAYAPDFLLYNKALNPWGRDREVPKLAKQSFREWYLANRSSHAS